MSWSTKRKLIYISVLLIIFVIFIVIPAFITTYRAPTCFDGKQNHGEQGVDCGGPCNLLCKAQALPPIVHWKRAFKIAPGYYNAVAYIENVNIDSEAHAVPYVFKFYDNKKILIAQRKGVTDIIANRKFPVFEPNIETGKSGVDSVSFTITDTPVWFTIPRSVDDVTVTDIVLTREDSAPKLSALVTNSGFNSYKNIPVVAILYDDNNNAITASRTYIDSLRAKDDYTVIFTWQQSFATHVSLKEIIPLVRTGNR